ncbi:Basic-leucine zipper domain [Dillenia turbinata]|uniref:Basic-leucine zipper domain n=1 Tax=Dillenia turbinata TaxID=194707 RepID=A0AAN8VVL2_9MAGN
MGTQAMCSQGFGQQTLMQPLARQSSSWYSLTLDEVGSQLGDVGKPLGSMNLDELLKSVWRAEANQAEGMDLDSASMVASSLQKQTSLKLARALTNKTVDEVWREIQCGENKVNGGEMEGVEREHTFGGVTLEDFLAKAGVLAETSLSPAIGFDTVDAATPHILPQQLSLSPSPSIGTLMDTPFSGRKRDVPYSLEKTVERRLRRKIKNRESAARSRARKQAYHNELVSKVSRLEEENLRLKKEKELEKLFPYDSAAKPKHQLRRTSSASF